MFFFRSNFPATCRKPPNYLHSSGSAPLQAALYNVYISYPVKTDFHHDFFNKQYITITVQTTYNNAS